MAYEIVRVQNVWHFFLKGASLRDQQVELGISAFEPTFGGRLRARGCIIFKPAKA